MNACIHNKTKRQIPILGIPSNGIDSETNKRLIYSKVAACRVAVAVVLDYKRVAAASECELVAVAAVLAVGVYSGTLTNSVSVYDSAAMENVAASEVDHSVLVHLDIPYSFFH